MPNNFNRRNFFEVYLEDRRIPDPDMLLGKALKYLKKLGRKVSLLGFDESSTPIINIDGELYVFDKYFGIWEHARFTKTDKNISNENSVERKQKIESYL